MAYYFISLSTLVWARLKISQEGRLTIVAAIAHCSCVRGSCTWNGDCPAAALSTVALAHTYTHAYICAAVRSDLNAFGYDHIVICTPKVSEPTAVDRHTRAGGPR